MRLVYSREAVADLVRLRAFISENDPAAAARVAAELVSRVDRLCAFPEMGYRVVQAPDAESIRDFAFGKYVVRYLVHGTGVVVLRIWHHHEDRKGSA